MVHVDDNRAMFEFFIIVDDRFACLTPIVMVDRALELFVLSIFMHQILVLKGYTKTLHDSAKLLATPCMPMFFFAVDATAVRSKRSYHAIYHYHTMLDHP